MEIKLNIKSAYLRKYLEFLFKQKEGKFVVRTTVNFGGLLFACVKFSDTPVQVEQSEQTVTFILPKTKNVHYYAEKSNIYYDTPDIDFLNRMLDEIFKIDFDKFYLNGIKNGLKQSKTINSYILSRNLIFKDYDIKDMLKKRVQRYAN